MCVTISVRLESVPCLSSSLRIENNIVSDPFPARRLNTRNSAESVTCEQAFDYKVRIEIVHPNSVCSTSIIYYTIFNFLLLNTCVRRQLVYNVTPTIFMTHIGLHDLSDSNYSFLCVVRRVINLIIL